jgi:hypothetical protein
VAARERPGWARQRAARSTLWGHSGGALCLAPTPRPVDVWRTQSVLFGGWAAIHGADRCLGRCVGDFCRRLGPESRGSPRRCSCDRSHRRNRCDPLGSAWGESQASRGAPHTRLARARFSRRSLRSRLAGIATDRTPRRERPCSSRFQFVSKWARRGDGPTRCFGFLLRSGRRGSNPY